jgi:hypothetical protein
MKSHTIEVRARESLNLVGGLSEHKKVIHNLLAKLEGIQHDRSNWKEATIDCDLQFLDTLQELEATKATLQTEVRINSCLNERIIELEQITPKTGRAERGWMELLQTLATRNAENQNLRDVLLGKEIQIEDLRTAVADCEREIENQSYLHGPMADLWEKNILRIKDLEAQVGEFEELTCVLKKENSRLKTQANLANGYTEGAVAESNQAGIERGYNDGWDVCQSRNNDLLDEMGKKLFDCQAANVILKADNALLEDAATCMERTVDYFCGHVTDLLKINSKLRENLTTCRQMLNQED